MEQLLLLFLAKTSLIAPFKVFPDDWPKCTQNSPRNAHAVNLHVCTMKNNSLGSPAFPGVVFEQLRGGIITKSRTSLYADCPNGSGIQLEWPLSAYRNRNRKHRMQPSGDDDNKSRGIGCIGPATWAIRWGRYGRLNTVHSVINSPTATTRDNRFSCYTDTHSATYQRYNGPTT